MTYRELKKFAISEAMFRLGDLFHKKIHADPAIIVSKKNISSVKKQIDIKYKKANDLSYDLELLLFLDKSLKIPMARYDQSWSEKGYKFLHTRSVGDMQMGILNSLWFRPEWSRIINNKYTLRNFELKQPVVYWRGSRSLQSEFHYKCKRSPYYDMCSYKKNVLHNYRDIIVKHFKNKSNKFIDIKYISKDRVSLARYIQNINYNYKYLIYLEGNAGGGAEFWMYNTNCVIIRQDILKSNSIYDHYIKPWKHYVPYQVGDFDDLVDKVIWCENNPSKCKDIIVNANNVHKLINDNNLRVKTFKIMAEIIHQNIIL